MKVRGRRHHGRFSATDDALVLASVSSPAEEELLSDWLHRQRGEHPDTKVEVLKLPADDDPPPGVLARLVEILEADEDRSVVPVRVFWVPGGLPTRSKVVALLSGRDTYCPPKILQRSILKRDPSRARVVAGEPAKVSELRQQWSDNTVAENPQRIRAVRDPPGDPGHRTGRAAAAGARIQVAATDQAGGAGVGAVP